MSGTDARANPLAGNPLRTRHDLRRAVEDLVSPLAAHLSPGGARVRLGSAGAVFSTRVAELEGFARPLWGLVPLAAGGAGFPHLDRWRAGLEAGTDPDHPEYWGAVGGDMDQRMVEQAAIGFGLAAVPELLWEPLSAGTRDAVVTWLRGIERHEPAPNNWHFFRVLVALALERLGLEPDRDALDRSLRLLDGWYDGDGWYHDGVLDTVDHYVGWAFHTYGLLYAGLHRRHGVGDAVWSRRFIDRAAAFAPHFRHWFGPDGSGLAYGRSLTYRFAQAAFWSALVYADVEALPWAQVKGLLLRHLRWWSGHPISDRDGVLSLGYTYGSATLAESYSSPGSPYWALKAFLALAAPADHPVWSAPEAPVPASEGPVAQPASGFVLDCDDRAVLALWGRRCAPAAFPEEGPAKYRRFAYSSHAGCCADRRSVLGPPSLADSMLTLIDPATGTRRIRVSVEDAWMDGEELVTTWRPWTDVTVETRLVAAAPWHRRIHRIRTARALQALEAGFALAVDPDGGTEWDLGPGVASARSDAGSSVVVDLDRSRMGEAHRPPPNSCLTAAHVAIPALAGELAVGTHQLRCAVLVTDDRAGGQVAVPARLRPGGPPEGPS